MTPEIDEPRPEPEISSPETAAAVLAYVGENPRTSVRVIAQAVGVGASTAHRAVARLVRDGLLQVERMGSSRGYPSAYLLSDAGAATAPDSVATVPNTPGTPRRTIRVPDDEWEAAQAKAEERGENLSEEIRKFLRRYSRRTSGA